MSGGVAREWPQVPIGEVAEVFDGPHATPKTVDSGPIFLGIGALQNGRINLGETRHVTPEDFQAWTRRVKPRAGDVVFSYETRLGEAAIIPSGLECCLGRRMGLVRADKGRLDSRYFLYLYLSPYFQEIIRSRTIPGATVDRIALKEFPSFPIPLPELAEQRAIAHILGTLDDKIELNRKQNETLEAMARALFKAWFVDFEPVLAKMENRWQRGQSLPGLPAHLYDLFPDRLVESELGEIPEGWEVVPASRLIEFNPSEPLRKEAEAPYIEMAALPTSGSWPDSPVLRPFGSGMRFRNGDTLLARITPCLENGKTAFVQCLPDNTVGWGSTEYIVMRPKHPVPKEFGYLLARDAAFREQAIRSMTGTSGRQRVQSDSVAAFRLAAPSNEDVWNAFLGVAAPTFMSIKANAEAIVTLAQLRDTLLPKLISGELRVPDAEAFLKERAMTEPTQLVIFEADSGQVQVRLEGETVWLRQEQMAELFGRERSVITKHLRNVFAEGELDEKSNVQNLHIAGSDKPVRFYNLDVIISVGYRVKSQQGTRFRQWATHVLREHLTQGYTLNRQRFEQNAAELEAALALVKKAAAGAALTGDQGRGLVDVIARYTQTFLWLQRYDEGLLAEPTGSPGGMLPSLAEARAGIARLKADLMARKEATMLFGNERDDAFAATLGNLEQTVFGEPAYPTVETKAAHLLYFVIKNHPFSDGNKRIGSYLFVDFLARNGRLLRDGEPVINDVGLAALALLVAESDPKAKDVMIRLIENMLAPSQIRKEA